MIIYFPDCTVFCKMFFLSKRTQAWTFLCRNELTARGQRWTTIRDPVGRSVEIFTSVIYLHVRNRSYVATTKDFSLDLLFFILHFLVKYLFQIPRSYRVLLPPNSHWQRLFRHRPANILFWIKKETFSDIRHIENTNVRSSISVNS